jgi:signal transduction histidine kinase/phage shock protein PspC (stress-responsive transcriptional regulator)
VSSTQRLPQRPAPIIPPVVVPTVARPALVRPHEGRLIGGVAAGLAGHLGWPVRAVRIGLIGLCFASGFGLVLYAWLWALVPAADSVPAPRTPTVPPGGVTTSPFGGPAVAASPIPSVGTSAAGSASSMSAGLVAPGPMSAGLVAPGSVASGSLAPGLAAPGLAATPAAVPMAPSAVAGRAARPARLPIRASGHLGDIGFGLVLLLAAAAVIGARYGWSPGLGLVIPLLVVIVGVALAYSQLDEVERSQWLVRTGGSTRSAVLRVAAGMAIVLVGVLLVVVQRTDLASVGRVLTATAAVVGGIALVLAPWGVRLWRDLDAERAARVRESERAEIAAHLHDSVLQTLALIQRSADDGTQVARLARAQERDLRNWLYGPKTATEATVASQVRQAAAEVEDRLGVSVELVVVGDRPVDDGVGALVAALREAMVNAVRHAGAPVSVYVEVGPDDVEAFVRDRGPGFELATVPADRRGVRDSIIGRMERHGGTAQVRTDADGTEVRLRLPIADADQDSTDRDRPDRDQPDRDQPDRDQPDRDQPDQAEEVIP